MVHIHVIIQMIGQLWIIDDIFIKLQILVKMNVNAYLFTHVDLGVAFDQGKMFVRLIVTKL